MDDDIAKVDDQPAGVDASLMTSRRDTYSGQRMVDLLNNRLELAFTLAAADNEVVGKTANTAQVEQQDIGRLSLQCRIHDLLGDIDCFQ